MNIHLNKTRSLFLDKTELRRLMAIQRTEMGITPDPNATAEQAQAMSFALSIRPDENLLSQGIIAARNEA